MNPQRKQLEFYERLGDSWRDLADILNISRHIVTTFTQGREPQAIWRWLVERDRLEKLPEALKVIDREDLVGLCPALPEQALSDAEGVSVPGRLRDGSVVWVNLDRRTLLRTGAESSPVVADSGALPGMFHNARAASAYGSTPVEHLRRTRRLLIDSDNQLGPRQVVSAVRNHIQVLQSLRGDAEGTDRRDLMELQTRYGEFLSWLYHDLGDSKAASYWLDRAMQWSQMVGNNDLTTYVMARKAQLAADTADLVDVVDLAEAAQRMARPRSRLAAMARTYEAYGHALRGEADESERAIDDVRNALDGAPADPIPWGAWLNVSYVEMYRAQSLEVLGEHGQAADGFAAAIRMMPDGYYRDRGVYMARQAVSLAKAQAPERAATIGMHALTVAEDTGSGRITNELARLDKALNPWQRVPEVGEFRATFDASLVHETDSEGLADDHPPVCSAVRRHVSRRLPGRHQPRAVEAIQRSGLRPRGPSPRRMRCHPDRRKHHTPG